VHLLQVALVVRVAPVAQAALLVPVALVVPALAVALVEALALLVEHPVQLVPALAPTVPVSVVAVVVPAVEPQVHSVKVAARASRASRRQLSGPNSNSAKPRRLVAYRFLRVTAPRSSVFVVAHRWPTSLKRLARAPRTS
jgi:hypothetical protein